MRSWYVFWYLVKIEKEERFSYHSYFQNKKHIFAPLCICLAKYKINYSG